MLLVSSPSSYAQRGHVTRLLGKQKESLLPTGDALRKPMLARGELRCIGATTVDEYRMLGAGQGAMAGGDQPLQRIGIEPHLTLGEPPQLSSGLSTYLISPRASGW